MRSILWIGASIAVLVASAASAQSVELTPFVGYRFGGAFVSEFGDNDFEDTDVEGSESFGMILGVAVADHWKVELIYDSQATEASVDGGLFGRENLDVDIDYYHVGTTYEWVLDTPARPYVAGSAGATDFGIDGGGDETRFSMSLGGGVKVLPNEHFGVRIDGRWYWTFIEQEDELVCGDRGCLTFNDSTLLFQWDVKVGLVFKF